MQEKPDTAPPAPVVDDSKPRQVSNFPFPAAFLRLKTVGVWFKFRVGEHAINNFRMIGLLDINCVFETVTHRHYHTQSATSSRAR